MVRLNGTRGKHRKTKMHKNKSRKHKRGGILNPLQPGIRSKEDLIEFMNDNNKMKKFTTNAELVSARIIKRTKNNYNALVARNQNKNNENGYVMNNPTKTQQFTNKGKTESFLGHYNLAELREHKNYIIYDTKFKTFREYTFDYNEFIPLNKTIYKKDQSNNTNDTIMNSMIKIQPKELKITEYQLAKDKNDKISDRYEIYKIPE